ncbi:MAG: hypothetical protein ABI583_02530 [Betaproteobacteria bacterium]
MSVTINICEDQLMSNTFKIAHIREQNVDLILIPLEDNFRYKVEDEQIRTKNALQHYAAAAGLAGTVIPVWNDGGGRMAFIAPRAWHNFLCSIGMAFVHANLNRELRCG